MICISCKKKESTEYEEIGLGKYCQNCLDRENKIWEQELGWNDSIFK